MARPVERLQREVFKRPKADLPLDSARDARAHCDARVRAKRGALPDDWRRALERGDCSAEEALVGCVSGAPAPRTYFERAIQADRDYVLFAEYAFFERFEAARALRFNEMRKCCEAVGSYVFVGELVGAWDLVVGRCDISHRATPKMFQFGGPDGRLVLAVRDETFLRCDAVAFRLDQPDDFALLLGQAAMLGEWHVRDLVGERGRLKLVANPLEWIRAGGEAVCVLDWARAVWMLRELGEGVTIECAPELASVVRAKLARGGLPLVAADIAANGRMSTAERLGREAV